MNMTRLKCLLCAALMWAVGTATGCSASGDGDTGGNSSGDTDSPPDTSMCADYCRNVMDCANGWGGGGQQYSSQSGCQAACVDFVEQGGGCGGAASDYFLCAASITDCDEYGELHAAQCADLEDGFDGWCMP